jgi:hypothetical protein
MLPSDGKQVWGLLIKRLHGHGTDPPKSQRENMNERSFFYASCIMPLSRVGITKVAIPPVHSKEHLPGDEDTP